MMKVKYIETFPDKIEKIFDNSFEYCKFFDQRFKEVNELLDFEAGNFPKWKYEKFKIKKDGTPRKYHYPSQLFTKKARHNQEKNFAEFQERKRHNAVETKFLKKHQDIMVAMEWGFKAHERGWNLEETKSEFIEELKKRLTN